jgi:hypothetical protein
VRLLVQNTKRWRELEGRQREAGGIEEAGMERDGWRGGEGEGAGDETKRTTPMQRNTEVRGLVLLEGAGKSSECRTVYPCDSNSEFHCRPNNW